MQKLAILPKTPATLQRTLCRLLKISIALAPRPQIRTNLIQGFAGASFQILDYHVTTNKVTVSSNRKLLEILDVSRLADNEADNNCDVGDLTFSTLLNNIAKCKYFDIPDAKILSSTADGINFLHINLRSINNQENFDKLYEFLIFLPSLPDVVFVSETRLKDDPLINICLAKYSFVQADSLMNAGGFGIYVLSKFQFEVVPTLEIKIIGCENLWLNILNEKARYKFTIGALYPKSGL